MGAWSRIARPSHRPIRLYIVGVGAAILLVSKSAVSMCSARPAPSPERKRDTERNHPTLGTPRATVALPRSPRAGAVKEFGWLLCVSVNDAWLDQLASKLSASFGGRDPSDPAILAGIEAALRRIRNLVSRMD